LAVDNSSFSRIIRNFRRVVVIKIRSLEGLVGGKILRISQRKEGDAGAMTPAHGALPADEAPGFKVEEGPPDLGQGKAGDPGELAQAHLNNAVFLGPSGEKREN
jgi:hypothetical protein